MTRKRKVLLVIIGTFIVLLGGIASYAFFTAQILGNPTNNNTRVNMNDLKLTFSDQTGLVEGNGITPGWTHQKIVTVENTGSASVTYDLVWLNVENELLNDEMVYSITCTSNCNGLQETPIPSLGEKLKIVTNTIDENETQTYTITFTFKELNTSQDYNQNKNFSGNIGILETGTYEEKYIGELLSTDWTYTVDDINKTVSLSKYKNTSTNVEIYPYYIENGNIYRTIINIAGEYNTLFSDGPGNNFIESVVFLGNVEFANNSMAYMFKYCSKLNNVDLSKLDTSNITNMRNMFEACTSLTSLDLSNFNTQNVTNTNHMFAFCWKLTTIYVSDLFDLTVVDDSNYMFRDCSLLVGGNGTTYDSSKNDGTYARIDVSGTPGYFTAKPSQS